MGSTIRQVVRRRRGHRAAPFLELDERLRIRLQEILEPRFIGDAGAFAVGEHHPDVVQVRARNKNSTFKRRDLVGRGPEQLAHQRDHVERVPPVVERVSRKRVPGQVKSVGGPPAKITDHHLLMRVRFRGEDLP